MTKKSKVLITLIIAALAAFPLVPNKYVLLLLFHYLIFAVLAMTWNFLAGFSGLVCLGYGIFVGLAAYCAGFFTLSGASTLLGLVVGAFVAGVAGIFLAVPTLRLRGVFFAIGSLVLCEALRSFFTVFKPTEGAFWGGVGIPIRAAIDLRELYYLALLVALTCFLCLREVLKSKLGLGLLAIRGNERAAVTCGVPVFRCKLVALAICAFFTGLAGGVFYLFQGHVEPNSAFSISWTMLAAIGVILGGIGSLEGPLLGAGFAVIFHITLAKYAGLSFLIEGALIMGMILWQPRGVARLLR